MNWNEYFFREVYLAASKSKDPSTHVGAVLVRDNNSFSRGYNGFPRGIEDDNRLLDRPTKLALICHAEENAILNAAREGRATLGSTLYTNGTPCNECAKAVIQSGIKKIFIHKEWEDIFYKREGWIELHKFTIKNFKKVKIPIISCSIKLNINTLCDGKVINI
jgi:dCMP deaminase